MGPTASGKSALALRARRALSGRDRQRRLGAGLSRHGHRHGQARRGDARARPAPSDRHHRPDRGLFGGALPRRRAGGRWPRSARAAGVPLLVGGTMLYFKALHEGLSALPPADPALRARDRRARRGRTAGRRCTPSSRGSIPVTAARLAPSDAQRIQRALEVYALTGTPLSRAAGRAGDRRRAGRARSRSRCCRPTARGCTRRIAERFDAMLAAGLVDELRALRARYRAARPSCRRCAASATGRRGQFLDGAIDAAGAARDRHRRDAPARQAPAHLAARDCRRTRSTPRRRTSLDAVAARVDRPRCAGPACSRSSGRAVR